MVPRFNPQPATAAEHTPDDATLEFSFRYAPWKNVLEWFAEQADLSLVMETPPPGTFNYNDSHGYSIADSIDLLNSVLLTKGYTLVRRERMLMLVNLEDGIPPNLITRVDAADLDGRGKYELLSCVFQLRRLSPEDAERNWEN